MNNMWAVVFFLFFMSTVHLEEITSKEQILVRTQPLLRQVHTAHVYEDKMQAVTGDREHYGAHHKPRGCFSPTLRE